MTARTTRGELQIVIWNPRDMTLLGSIDMSAAIDPDYAELDYGEPVAFGDYVAWPMLWNDSNAQRYKPDVGVVPAARAYGRAPASCSTPASMSEGAPELAAGIVGTVGTGTVGSVGGTPGSALPTTGAAGPPAAADVGASARDSPASAAT